MTNKQLQAYLKQFPDDAQIWEQDDEFYGPKKPRIINTTILRIPRYKDKYGRCKHAHIRWSEAYKNPKYSEVKIIVL